MSKSFQALLDQSTSEYLIHPDPVLYQSCTDLLNRPDPYPLSRPKDAFKLIKRRLQNHNPKIQILTLELLSRAVDTCGYPVHTQVFSKDYIALFISMMKGQGTDSEVKERLEGLVVKWGERYRGMYGTMPGFLELLEATNRPHSEVQLRSYSETEEPRSRSVSSVLPTTRLAKLRSDLEVVREHINLANEMIAAGDPVEDNEALDEVVETLKEMRVRLVKVVEVLEKEEGIVEEGIRGKELVDETLERYKAWKEGRTVKPMDIFADTFGDVRHATSFFLPATAFQTQPLLPSDSPPRPMHESLIRKSGS